MADNEANENAPLMRLIAGRYRVAVDEIKDSYRFKKELKGTDLDFFELVLDAEAEYKLRFDDIALRGVGTVGELKMLLDKTRGDKERGNDE